MKPKIIFVIVAVGLLIAGCYLPWMTVESKSLTITGMDTTGTLFGKPGLFHVIWGGLYLVFALMPAVWSQRIALVMAAFNTAWVLRNFLLLPACQMGECPVRRTGLYVVLFASALLIASVFVAPKRRTPKAA